MRCRRRIRASATGRSFTAFVLKVAEWVESGFVISAGEKA